MIAPLTIPTQENNIPKPKPYIFTFAAIMTIRGKKGRNASSSGTSIPGKGPRLDRLSRNCSICSNVIQYDSPFQQFNIGYIFSIYYVFRCSKCPAEFKIRSRISSQCYFVIKVGLFELPLQIEVQ